MMPHQKNLSVGNISGDSGVLEMDTIMKNAAHHGHFRQASNATSCYSADTGYNEQQHQNGDNRTNMTAKVRRKLQCQINGRTAVVLIAAMVALLALLFYLYLPLLVTKILQSIINIRPNGEFYNFWIESSEPTEVGIHFFHVENPWAVQHGLEKLKIKETGRYYFKQRFVREVNKFSPDQTIVNFIEKRYFYFDEEKTELSLDDNITVVNVPYAALSSLVPNYVENMPGDFLSFNMLSHMSYRGINEFLDQHNQHLFINTTIRKLLYGYRLDILDTAESVFSKLGFDIMPKELFPNNSFGILNGRNGTPDGPYEMFTGLSGTQEKFGYIKTWKNKTKLDFWKADSCNSINGTDGTIWPAGITPNDRLDFFIPDICRSLYVTFQEKSSYKGIPTYLFSAPDSVLAGKHTNPDNECFCMEEDEELADERCVDGIFDLSGCQNGIPLIVTLPHFLGADARITQEIEGLKADPEMHRPVLHIEPKMGLVIHGDSRLQMAIRVSPNENLRGFDKLKKDLYIPIFWGYKKLGMSDEMAHNLKFRLFVPVKVFELIMILLMLCGISVSIYGFIKWISFNTMVIKFRDVESVAQKGVYFDKSETENMMPRVESQTSDLGDSKSESDSLPDDDDSPGSSVIELQSLVRSAETDIC